MQQTDATNLVQALAQGEVHHVFCGDSFGCEPDPRRLTRVVEQHVVSNRSAPAIELHTLNNVLPGIVHLIRNEVGFQQLNGIWCFRQVLVVRHRPANVLAEYIAIPEP